MDGVLAGGLARATDSIDIKVRVQCSSWIDIDRIQVLVNGRALEKLNFTRSSHKEWFTNGVVKFDRIIPIPLSEDAHIIVVAYGSESDLSWDMEAVAKQAFAHVLTTTRFCGYRWHGFTPNGDTLGFPYPQVKYRLMKRNNKWLRLASLWMKA